MDAIKMGFRKKITFRQLFNHLLFRIYGRRHVYLRHKPITLTFAVTDRCTFQCRMCHLHSSAIQREPHFNVKKKDLPFDLFHDVLRTFPQARNVTFVGTGEPLLHKDFKKMVDLADTCHMVTSTITNGLLLDRQTDLILSSSLDHISISVNGACKEDFTRLTGMEEEHFTRIVANAKAFVAARNRRRHPLKIAVSFILDQQNYRQTEKMMWLAREMGVDLCALHNFISSSTKGFTAEERSLFRNRETVDYFRGIPTPGDMAVIFPRLLRQDRIFKGCHFLFNTLRIDSEGNTGSCGGSLLNLDGHSPYTEPGVWNNDDLVSMRKKFLFRQKQLPDPCYECPHNY